MDKIIIIIIKKEEAPTTFHILHNYQNHISFTPHSSSPSLLTQKP